MGGGRVDENGDPSSKEAASLFVEFPTWNLLNRSVTPSDLCRAPYLESLKQVSRSVGFQPPGCGLGRARCALFQLLGWILPWSAWQPDVGLQGAPAHAQRVSRVPQPLEGKSLCSRGRQALAPVSDWGLDLVSLSSVTAYWSVCSSRVGGGGRRHGSCY